MESQATLVRSQGRVELNSISAINAELAIVVLPCHTELNDTLWDGANFERRSVLGVLLEEGAVFKGTGELCGGRKHESANLSRHYCLLVPWGEGGQKHVGTHLCRPVQTRAQKAG